VKGVILAPDFDPNHFRGVNLDAIDRAIDSLGSNDVPIPTEFDTLVGGQAGWQEQSFQISIPQTRTGRRPLAPMISGSVEDHGHILSLSGFHSRSLTDVIRSHFSSSESGTLHYVPYEHWWTPGPGIPNQRLYDELYTGDVWIREHAALQRSPPVPGCKLERVIAALMLWSDATHLAQFGQSSLWPIYGFFGNQSKSTRRQPLSRSSEHIAFLPKVQFSYICPQHTLTLLQITGATKSQIEGALGGKAVTADMQAHVKREIFNACLAILLDDDFVRAYREGMKIVCSDGVERRVYPRIPTYSADYPEK
jgi:hypothetical protein